MWWFRKTPRTLKISIPKPHMKMGRDGYWHCSWNAIHALGVLPTDAYIVWRSRYLWIQHGIDDDRVTVRRMDDK